jgi:hypothetical protein
METPSLGSQPSMNERALAAPMAPGASAVESGSAQRHPAVESALREVHRDAAIDELSHPWDARLAPARSQPWGASRAAIRFDDFAF